jgi:hypothetical protein
VKRIKKLFIALGIIALLFKPLLLVEASGTYGSGDSANGIEPRLIIESYDIVKGVAIPGEQITVKFVLKNASEEKSVTNILMSYAALDNVLYPVSGDSNQVFIDQIAPEETFEAKIKLMVADEYIESTAPLSFNFQYQDKSSNRYANQVDFLFPIVQETILDVYGISVVNTSQLGAKTLVSFNYGNIGSEDIYNVMMNLEGDIVEQQKNLQLGDIVSGGKQYLDYYVNFQNIGEQKLKITYTYEDAQGKVFTIEPKDFIVKVTEKKKQSEDKLKEKNTVVPPKLELWKVLCIVGIGGSIIIIILIIANTFKKR